MINYIKKDITTVERGIIAHGCNASGGFGSGVAGAIKNRWPEVAAEYHRQYAAGACQLGTAHIVNINDGLYVANMITQQNCGYDGAVYADLAAIEATMEYAAALSDVYALPLYVPKIGCGLGGLDFETEVKPIYEMIVINNLDIEINVCDF